MIRQNDLGVHRHHLMPVHFDPLCHEEGGTFALDHSAQSWLTLFFQREETERFRKIDAKRGGRGFV
jgi:hypothetical protein